jgi:hypothetical protein
MKADEEDGGRRGGSLSSTTEGGLRGGKVSSSDDGVCNGSSLFLVSDGGPRGRTRSSLNAICLSGGVLFSTSEEGRVGGIVFSEISCRVRNGIFEGEERTNDVVRGEPAIVANSLLIGDGVLVEIGTLGRNLGVDGVFFSSSKSVTKGCVTVFSSSCKGVSKGGVTIFSGGPDDTSSRGGGRSVEDAGSLVNESFGIKELADDREIDEVPKTCRVGNLFLRGIRDRRGRWNDGVGISLDPVFLSPLFSNGVFLSDGSSLNFLTPSRDCLHEIVSYCEPWLVNTSGTHLDRGFRNAGDHVLLS